MMKILDIISSFLIWGKKRKLVECSTHYKFMRGMELLDAGDRSGALQYFTDEINDCNENGFAHGHIGRLYYDAQMYGAALNATNQAINNLKPDKGALCSGYCLRAEINRELGNEKDMLDDLAIAISLNQKEIEPFEIRSKWYFMKGEYEKAIADLMKISELEPGNAFSYAAIGYNLLVQNKLDEARERFEYSILLDPSYSAAYSLLADCKFQQGDIIGCVDDCIKCLSLDEKDDKALNIMLSQVLVHDSRLFDSKLKICIQKEPNNETWPRIMAMGYSAREEYSRAIIMWHKAYDIRPKNIYHMLMADDYMRFGDYQNAEHILRRVLIDDDGCVEARQNLGDVLICQTRYEEALKEFEICNSMKPEDTLLMCKLADTYRMLKRYDEAMEYAQTSVCLEPDSSDGWLSLAYIYEVQGNTAMQKDALERIVSLEHPVSHHKAIALAFLGNADDAINALESNNADFHEVEDVYHLWYMAYILVIAGRIDAASAALQKSFEVGMRNFKSIINQDVYQCMQQIPNLLDLISYWQEQANNEFKELNQSFYKHREDEITESVFTIPFNSINGE